MADIKCYGVINQGFADDLRRSILRIPAAEPIELKISSPGGYLSEGITAYNILKRAPNEVIAYLDGDAFSAATLLTTSCRAARIWSAISRSVSSTDFSGSSAESSRALKLLEMTRPMRSKIPIATKPATAPGQSATGPFDGL